MDQYFASGKGLEGDPHVGSPLFCRVYRTMDLLTKVIRGSERSFAASLLLKAVARGAEVLVAKQLWARRFLTEVEADAAMAKKVSAAPAAMRPK